MRVKETWMSFCDLESTVFSAVESLFGDKGRQFCCCPSRSLPPSVEIIVAHLWIFLKAVLFFDTYFLPC